MKEVPVPVEKIVKKIVEKENIIEVRHFRLQDLG